MARRLILGCRHNVLPQLQIGVGWQGRGRCVSQRGMLADFMWEQALRLRWCKPIKIINDVDFLIE